MATTCITKAVSLAPGESFVLPPGATLIGASDSGAFTSTCDVPDLETLQCYVALIGASVIDGSVQQYFEATNSHALGIIYNGTYYPFSTVYSANFVGAFPLVPLMSDLGTQAAAAGAFIAATGTGIFTNPGNGILTFILIKTIPSVANNMVLRVRGTMRTSLTPGQSDLDLSSPFLPLQTWVDNGYTGMPACP